MLHLFSCGLRLSAQLCCICLHFVRIHRNYFRMQRNGSQSQSIAEGTARLEKLLRQTTIAEAPAAIAAAVRDGSIPLAVLAVIYLSKNCGILGPQQMDEGGRVCEPVAPASAHIERREEQLTIREYKMKGSFVYWGDAAAAGPTPLPSFRCGLVKLIYPTLIYGPITQSTALNLPTMRCVSELTWFYSGRVSYGGFIGWIPSWTSLLSSRKGKATTGGESVYVNAGRVKGKYAGLR